MDKLQQGMYPEVLVFADCNKTDLDPALVRRFDEYLEVSLPEDMDRLDFLKTLLKNEIKSDPLWQNSVQLQPKSETSSKNKKPEKYTKKPIKCTIQTLIDGSKNCSYKEIGQMVRSLRRKKAVAALKSEYFRVTKEGDYYPCSGAEDGTIKKISFKQIPTGKLKVPTLTFEEVEAAFKIPIKGTTAEDINKIKEFGMKYNID